jgi:hypothetical protein
MGACLAGVGVLVCALTAAVIAFSLPVIVLSIGVVVALLAVLGSGVLLTGRLTVVHLDATGYRVRFVRGAGVMVARWVDVEDVLATHVAGEACVVLRLRDGRATTVPVRILAGNPDDFVRDLQGRLNTGHGYRRIR